MQVHEGASNTFWQTFAHLATVKVQLCHYTPNLLANMEGHVTHVGELSLKFSIRALVVL